MIVRSAICDRGGGFGQQYMYEQGTDEMRLIPAEPGQIRTAPQAGASSSTAPADTMDVDEFEYVLEGKGKARARRKK